uniref:Uncharacterized protein n=1 Tax=Timema monikensis TaxID=170555 RepID=A0A7R9EJB4_9NEOP|nr:unnamed protein product [Timema monikensis]
MIVRKVFGIVCMACASPAILSGTHWFLFVVVTSFIATLIWVFVYLLGIREALKLPINWILTEREGERGSEREEHENHEELSGNTERKVQCTRRVVGLGAGAWNSTDRRIKFEGEEGMFA